MCWRDMIFLCRGEFSGFSILPILPPSHSKRVEYRRCPRPAFRTFNRAPSKHTAAVLPTRSLHTDIISYLPIICLGIEANAPEHAWMWSCSGGRRATDFRYLALVLHDIHTYVTVGKPHPRIHSRGGQARASARPAQAPLPGSIPSILGSEGRSRVCFVVGLVLLALCSLLSLFRDRYCIGKKRVTQDEWRCKCVEVRGVRDGNTG